MCGRVHVAIQTNTYSFCLYLIVVVGVWAINLTRFVEKYIQHLSFLNKFIKKLDSKTFLMILIMYHKY